MQRSSAFKTVDDFLQSPDDMKQKIVHLKRTSAAFMKKLDGSDRMKLWLALIPQSFSDKIRNFYRLAKIKNSVKVYTRHKVIVDYDTLYLAKRVNESDRDDQLLITNARLSMMRSVICLYLSYNRENEYHRGWSYISYVLMGLTTSEEETLIIFSYLVENVIPGFFKASDNYNAKLKSIGEFYMMAEKQKFSFSNLTHNSVFKNQQQDAEILDHVDPKTRTALFLNENIKNYGLYTVIRSVSDEWFGSLFSNILSLKDSLKLWDSLLLHDHHLLFKLGLSIINKSNSKLEQILKKERKGLLDLGIECSQHQLLSVAPQMKKQLLSYIQSSELQTHLNSVIDRKETSSSPGTEKKISFLGHEIANTVQEYRLKNFIELKKELESPIKLETARVATIFQIIDDCKTDKITIREILPLLVNNHITYVALSVKIFALIDQDVKGYVTKRDMKFFFAILSSGFEKKIKFAWKEVFKEKPQIEANEAIDILQTFDYFLNQNSTIFHENISCLYERMISRIPDANINIDSLAQFIKSNRICAPLVKQFNLIDGRLSEDLLVETESDDEEAFKTENEPNIDKLTRSVRFSSPTLNSSKGRASNSRKSFLGVELEKERQSVYNSNKEEPITENMLNLKTEEDRSPFEKTDAAASINNTDENLPGIRPPTFIVRFPIMTSKGRE